MAAHPTAVAARPRPRRRSLLLGAGLTTLLAALALAHLVLSPSAGAGHSARPNVVLFVTDDQTLEEMRALPFTAALIGGGGATFSRAYVSFPLCCPARATMLSGQYMHNHNVRGNLPPTGGWPVFRGLGTESRALPTWLDDAGYYNVHVGKYMNSYAGIGGAPAPVPPGWDEWYGKISQYNPALYGGKIYFNYEMREDPPVSGGVPCPEGPPNVPPGEPYTCSYRSDPSDYQTDVIRRKAVEAIGRLSDGTAPFFLNVQFNAPHAPYDPHPSAAFAYASAQIEKPRAFNEKRIKDKPRFLRRLPKLGKGKLNQITARRRLRLSMLFSVDQSIASIAFALLAKGELDNTYLIFTSDNGYFSGEHRIRQGKYLPHEPSSHVPLMIRGPGIPAGGTSEVLASDVDLASTIAEMTGAVPKLPQDGRSLLSYARQPWVTSGRPLLLEADTGPSIDDEGAEGPTADDPKFRKYLRGLKRKKKKLRRKCRALARGEKGSAKQALRCFRRGVRNLDQEPVDRFYKLRAPAYRAIRSDRYALFLYGTGEVELYDMRKDPNQLHSVAKNRRYRGVKRWLFDRLDELTFCAGATCSPEVDGEPAPKKKKKKKRKRR
ncbi:MAG: sulfatase family protein [Solirubrobacterales bacterium]